MKKLIEELCKNSMEYLFLSQFISADTINSIDEARKALSMIDELSKSLPETELSDEKKREINEYLETGKELIIRDWRVNPNGKGEVC